MTRKSGAWADPMAVTISCQNIKSSMRALLWQNDSRGCAVLFSTQMETDTLNASKSFFSLLAGSSFQRNCDNKRLILGTVCSFGWYCLTFSEVSFSCFWILKVFRLHQWQMTNIWGFILAFHFGKCCIRIKVALLLLVAANSENVQPFKSWFRISAQALVSEIDVTDTAIRQ